ncbi:hypothetical protein RvY_08157 [Ramazzottius varieornatus]|uniref:DJ-1/PfpI domain-containing protein n=1 Tax=Ramazzottius varieornatus TaxID=947166 RepID=A0A1D1V7L2_RAMVA|nr:hypothetical protein RvY_08157 [Ramazzottius varieornatus]
MADPCALISFCPLGVMSMRKQIVLIPLSRYGFDPEEVSVPYMYLKNAGHQVVFSTIDGYKGAADERMLTGKDLKMLASTLACDDEARSIYNQMEESIEFQYPIPWSEIRSEVYDSVCLPGGHDKAIREYLESELLQKIIGEFFAQEKPVAAICHGVLLVARSTHPRTRKSVLFGKKTTGLTKGQEKAAYNLTRLWLGDYYLTYPDIYLEDDVKQYLEKPEDFDEGPGYPIPMSRDSQDKPHDGFALLDGNYLSARWPGDVHRFSTEYCRLLATASVKKPIGKPIGTPLSLPVASAISESETSNSTASSTTELLA